MEQTDKKLAAMEVSIGSINQKLDDLTKFKIEMLATSRLAAFVVSAVAGMVTLIVSTVVTLYVSDRAAKSEPVRQEQGSRK